MDYVSLYKTMSMKQWPVPVLLMCCYSPLSYSDQLSHHVTRFNKKIVPEVSAIAEGKMSVKWRHALQGDVENIREVQVCCYFYHSFLFSPHFVVQGNIAIGWPTNSSAITASNAGKIQETWGE